MSHSSPRSYPLHAIEPLESRQLLSASVSVAVGSRILVAAIIDQSLVLSRYHTDGSADVRFGAGGADGDGVITVAAFPGTPAAVTAAPGGKFLVAGSSASGDFVVARYTSKGTLDPKFGRGGDDGDGVVTTDLGGDDHAMAIAVQHGSGKILVAGYSSIAFNGADFGVVRYKSNGTIDVSFQVDGIVTTPFGGQDKASAIAFGRHGTVIVAGSSESFDTTATDRESFAAARYLDDGELDTTFGTAGIAQLGFGGYSAADDLLVQKTGKIVLGGFANATDSSGSGGSFALARLNANGSLDDGSINDTRPADQFGAAGKVITAFSGATSSIAESLAVGHHGSILAAGSALGATTDFALAAFSADGAPLTALGGAGTVTADFNSQEETAFAVAPISHGRLLAVGFTHIALATHDDLALAEWSAAGVPVATFGGGDGQVITVLPDAV